MDAGIEPGSGARAEWKREPRNLGALLDTPADGREVCVMGWVERRRDLGALIFIWLRDRYLQEHSTAAEGAVVQVTFNPETSPDAHKLAEDVRGEFVVAVKGDWRMRAEKDVNPRLEGGDREVAAREMRVLSSAETPPFYVADDPKAGEDLRMEYRYLDLRRRPSARMLAARHRIFLSIRNVLSRLGFLEIETSMLGRSTPEGARDYLVPARNHPGRFYALPQSPQLLKQILMVSGVDRYFQMARCFRDEDLRANRQPEFTQLDLEMSFTTRDELFEVGEEVFVEAFREVLGVEIEAPFPRMTYDEAMSLYGIDKPDLRFGCKIIDFTGVFGKSRFEVLRKVLDAGGAVKGIFIPGFEPSRKELDDLAGQARDLGAGGLLWARFLDGEVEKTSFDKLFSDGERAAIGDLVSAEDGGILLIIAGSPARKAEKTLGALRLHIARKLGLAELVAKEGEWKFSWVVDFPLYELSGKTGEIVPTHHPFTMPGREFLEEYEPGRFRLLAETDEERLSIRADNYDLVLNGEELGSGSLRIHDSDLQRAVLRGLGMSEEEIEREFGFFLKALSFGAPPHRGFAFGMDRIVMMMLGLSSIRDVIAFPKTAEAKDLMSGAPGIVSELQIRDIGLGSEGGK